MRISNNPINNVITAKQPKTPEIKKGVNFGNNTQQLPSTHAVGMSQVNSNLPVGYTKLGEIPIPGLTEKASVFKLANGQRVVILPKKGPTQIKTTFNVGSLNETEDIRGISHYIEHNLFNGSKGLEPKEYDKKVSNMGGYTNASTSFSATDYYMTIQLLDDSFLEEGIKLNAAQVQYPTFPPAQLEKEKEAVKSEIDLYKDSISDVATSRVLKNLFNINTQSTNFILGTKQNINSFNQEKVLDYFNTWYTPDNSVTVITGDVDVNETIALVSKHYNKPADFSKVNQRHTEPLTCTNKPIRNDIIQKGSPISNISMGFAIPENTSDKDLEAIDMLLQILNSSDSKLTKALDKYGIYPGFGTENLQNNPNGAKAILTSINLPEEQIEDVLKILYSELTYIANNPPTMEEFQNAQTSSLRSLDNVAEYSEGINSTLTYMALKNDFNYLEKSRNIISTLTPADISAAARKFLDLNKVSLCVAHSEKTTTDTIKNNYNKANGANVSFGRANPNKDVQQETSKIREFKLHNNIETAIVPGNTTGQSAISMSIQTDTMPDASFPAISILSELLNRGSMQKGVDEYNKALNKNDISIFFDAASDGIDIQAIFYDDKMQETLSLMKETLSCPNFTEAEFQRAKANLKDALLNSRKSPLDNAYSTIFPNIRCFDNAEKQIEQLEQLTLADIQNLYNRILSASQCEVTCSAPVEQKPYLQDILHNNLATGMPMFQPAVINRELNSPSYTPITQAKTIAEAEENAQAQIIQAYTYKTTNNVEDETKIKLMNIILGSGMSSRLFTDLRENEKLAYRVNSSLAQKNDTGIIKLYISTTTDPETVGEGSPENAKKAIAGFNRNVELLKNQPVSEQELQQAKNSLKASLLSDREGNIGINSQMHGFRNSAYGLRQIELELEAIDKITVEDIQATANYVFGNQPITSIVASQSTLDALNL